MARPEAEESVHHENKDTGFPRETVPPFPARLRPSPLGFPASSSDITLLCLCLCLCLCLYLYLYLYLCLYFCFCLSL